MDIEKRHDIPERILAQLKNEQQKEILSAVDEHALWDRITLANQTVGRRKRMAIALASMVAAASIACLCLIQWNKSADTRPEVDYMAIIESSTRNRGASGNIQLVLSNEQTIQIDKKEAEIDYQEEQILVNSEKVGMKDGKAQQTFNQLIVPLGKRSSLTLADGTKMWVNSDTKVVYPVQFSDNKREIFVEGEVFLDVVRNENQPFIVKTRKVDITVLGTRFNVSTFEDGKPFELVLVHGAVEVETEHNQKIVLSPNQLFSYDTKTAKSNVTQVDVADYVAWKDGYYQFDHQPMHVILNKLKKYYNLEVKWEMNVAELRCTGKLDLKEDPSDVFVALQKAAPIVVEKDNGIIIVKVKPLN